jgi:hypothetical protein
LVGDEVQGEGRGDVGILAIHNGISMTKMIYHRNLLSLRMFPSASAWHLEREHSRQTWLS